MKEFIKLYYFDIFVAAMYAMTLYLIVDTYLLVRKGKMIIDYILELWERRNNDRHKRSS